VRSRLPSELLRAGRYPSQHLAHAWLHEPLRAGALGRVERTLDLDLLIFKRELNTKTDVYVLYPRIGLIYS